MIKLIFCVSLLSLCCWLSGCAVNPCRDKVYLFIVADKPFIGTSIFIDGQKVGLLEEQKYNGPEPQLKNFTYASGVRSTIVEKKEDPSSRYRDICVPPGKHKMMAVFRGYRIQKEFVTKEENFMKINFEGWEIKGP